MSAPTVPADPFRHSLRLLLDKNIPAWVALWAILTFDDPGQPAAIHRDGLTFRPDWENVVGPVLDFLTGQPGVDPSRIALLGVSLGGYLAPRAAAFERRPAAVVALDGVFDAVSALTAYLPLPQDEVVRRAAAEDDKELDRIIGDAPWISIDRAPDWMRTSVPT